MKIGILFLSLLLITSLSALATVQEEVSITDINWQEKERLFTYTLSKDAVVKIRVGSYAGPVYRTLVNLEKKKEGKNQEPWDGKDEEGGIDFLKYSKVHFCVDAPVKTDLDSVLNVKFIQGAKLAKDHIQMGRDNRIMVDLPNELRATFNKNGAELRVYLDHRLLKIERVNSLPYTFNLKIDGMARGRHFMVINLWSATDFSSVAYKSFEVLISKEKDEASSKSKEELKKSEADSSNEKVIFCRLGNDGFWQIFISTLDGRDVRQLTFSPVDKRNPSWSPEGREIAYVTNSGELWIMDAYGRSNRKIPLLINSSEPRFSPDGKKVIFTSPEDVYHGSTKIWQVDLDTLQLKKLVNRPWLQYNPNYSPDGTQVIFTDGPELFGQEIRILDVKTGDITQLTDNGPYNYDMQAIFLNSGQEIVYSTNEGTGDYEIYKMDKFGRDKINLSSSPQSCDIMPQVSKDDKTVYFLSDRSGNFAIWQMNIDGSEPKQITQNETDISTFSIFTD